MRKTKENIKGFMGMFSNSLYTRINYTVNRKEQNKKRGKNI